MDNVFVSETIVSTYRLNDTSSITFATQNLNQYLNIINCGATTFSVFDIEKIRDLLIKLYPIKSKEQKFTVAEDEQIGSSMFVVWEKIEDMTPIATFKSKVDAAAFATSKNAVQK